MEKYTENELEEIRSLLAKEDNDNLKEIIRYTKDEELINKTKGYKRIRRF